MGILIWWISTFWPAIREVKFLKMKYFFAVVEVVAVLPLKSIPLLLKMVPTWIISIAEIILGHPSSTENISGKGMIWCMKILLLQLSHSTITQHSWGSSTMSLILDLIMECIFKVLMMKTPLLFRKNMKFLPRQRTKWKFIMKTKVMKNNFSDLTTLMKFAYQALNTGILLYYLMTSRSLRTHATVEVEIIKEMESSMKISV